MVSNYLENGYAIVDFQIIAIAYIVSVFIKNILNLSSITAISPLFSETGIIGLTMGMVIGLFAIVYNANDSAEINNIKSIVIGISLANSAINCIWPFFCLILLLYVLYLYKMLQYKKLHQCFLSVLSAALGFEAISLIMLITNYCRERIIDKLICSFALDIIFMLILFVYHVKHKIKDAINKIISGKMLNCSILFCCIVLLFFFIYGLFFKEYMFIIPKYMLVMSFFFLVVLVVIAMMDKRLKPVTNIEHIMNYSKFVLRLVNGIVSFLIISIYITNLYVQDGAINGAYNYEWFSSVARFFGFRSVTFVYRSVVVINAFLVFLQFVLIKNSISLFFSLLFKDFKQSLYNKTSEANSVLLSALSTFIAFSCVLIPEILSQQRWAENFLLYLFELAVWGLIYSFILMIVKNQITKCNGVIFCLLIVAVLYFRVNSAFQYVPNMCIQLFIIIGAIVIAYCLDAWIDKLEEIFGNDAKKEKYDNETGIGISLMALILGIGIVSFFVKASSSLHSVVEVQNGYDEIQNVLEDVLSLSLGEIYYDPTVDSKVKFVIKEHMLRGQENEKLKYDSINIIYSEETELSELSKEDLRIRERDNQKCIKETLDNLLIDYDGYRLVSLSNKGLMRLIIDSNQYCSVTSIGDTIILTQNPRMEEELRGTDYNTKKMKYFSMDVAEIELNGWIAKYAGDEPSQDAELEGYVFRFAFPTRDESEMFNVDDYSLDYHLYQNNILVSYDHSRVKLPKWITDESMVDLELNLEEMCSDEKNLVEFNPEEEYEIVIDLVHEGVEWLSYTRPEACLTFIHQKDGSWKVKQQ